LETRCNALEAVFGEREGEEIGGGGGGGGVGDGFGEDNVAGGEQQRGAKVPVTTTEVVESVTSK
jgi:hypothetical protein